MPSTMFLLNDTFVIGSYLYKKTLKIFQCTPAEFHILPSSRKSECFISVLWSE